MKIASPRGFMKQCLIDVKDTPGMQIFDVRSMLYLIRLITKLHEINVLRENRS